MTGPERPDVSAFIAALDGLRVPGGCDCCDAYQTVRAHAGGPDIHLVTIHHDDWCPWLAAYEATFKRRAPKGDTPG